MKRHLIILSFLLIAISSFSDYRLTRGPNIGEVYYIGPTYSGLGIYHSTDFGNTAVCVDSTTNATGVVADLSEGVLYYRNMGEALYISYNHGQQGTWQLQNGGIYPGFASGRIEGEIYNIIVSHSDNYGETFNPHSYNGFFGNYFESEIDNQPDIGYLLTYKSSVADSVYLLKSIDNYENLELNRVFNFHWNDAITLTRGTNSGELYLLNSTNRELWFTNDFSESWIKVDNINFGSSPYGATIVGGRQNGEVYIKYDFVNLMWQNAHTYIFHSTDYGKTFEVFHPFGKGNEPVLANFSTTENEVLLTTPVAFSNFSIGNILEYQWDFENDGVIDSYDEFPTHTYQDTGYYSVKLSVVGADSTNTFIKENYIHVIDTITSSPDLNYQAVSVSPNPFNKRISIELRQDFEMIEILDLNGKSHFSKKIYPENKIEILDLKQLKKGIFILKIRTKGKDITKKIIKN